MPAPAAEPFYALTCKEPPPPAAALEGPAATRVAVVGGGLAGLAVALSLAERGIAVTLVEAGELGQGASGRNGGMVSAGFTRGAQALVRDLGAASAIALHAQSRAGQALIRRRLQAYAIPADPVDGVVVASCFADPAGLRAKATFENATFGMRLEPKGRDWMAATYRTELYTEGLLDPDGFHLDPLALVRGYARAAAGLGAVLHAHSPLCDLVQEGAGWRLRTPAGELTAEHVVLATNTGPATITGAARALVAEGQGAAELARLRRAILPVATYIIVTEPLGERLGQAVGAPFAVYDDRFATGYYRPLPGGRLLWGGRVALWPATSPAAIERLMRRDLAKVYPQLADVGIAAAWSGWMGFARHKMPLLGELAPGLWATGGYGGHGLNATTMGGELVAGAIAGDLGPLQAFARYRPRPVHGVLGKLAAAAIYRGNSLVDGLRIAARGLVGTGAGTGVGRDAGTA